MRKGLFLLLLCVPLFSQVSVFFTPSKNAEQEILKIIKNSKNSVYIVSYDFNHRKMIDILREKDIKKVKIIVDQNNSLSFGQNILKVFTGKGLLHSKFIVADEILIAGSGNFTDNDFCLFHNNFLIIKNNSIAEFFKEVFLSLWDGEKYIGKSLCSEEIEIYFSPEFDLEKKIISEIEKAKSSIYFCYFYFTSEIVASKLINCKSKGIEIKGIFERYNTSNYSTFYILKDTGIGVKKSNMAGFLHDKFIVIDEETVITGSYNLTTSAKKNHELLIIMRNEKVAEKYLREWKRLWKWKSLP